MAWLAEYKKENDGNAGVKRSSPTLAISRLLACLAHAATRGLNAARQLSDHIGPRLISHGACSASHADKQGGKKKPPDLGKRSAAALYQDILMLLPPINAPPLLPSPGRPDAAWRARRNSIPSNICQPAQLKGVGRVRHTTVTFFDQWCDLVSLNDQAANLPCLKLCVDFK